MAVRRPHITDQDFDSFGTDSPRLKTAFLQLPLITHNPPTGREIVQAEVCYHLAIHSCFHSTALTPSRVAFVTVLRLYSEEVTGVSTVVAEAIKKAVAAEYEAQFKTAADAVAAPLLAKIQEMKAAMALITGGPTDAQNTNNAQHTPWVLLPDVAPAAPFAMEDLEAAIDDIFAPLFNEMGDLSESMTALTVQMHIERARNARTTNYYLDLEHKPWLPVPEVGGARLPNNLPPITSRTNIAELSAAQMSAWGAYYDIPFNNNNLAEFKDALKEVLARRY